MFTAEWRRLRAFANSDRASQAAELERGKRAHGKLVAAIVAGLPTGQVKVSTGLEWGPGSASNRDPSVGLESWA